MISREPANDASLEKAACIRKCQLRSMPLPSQTPINHVCHNGHSPSISPSLSANQNSTYSGAVILTPTSTSSSPTTPTRQRRCPIYTPLSPCSTFNLNPSKAVQRQRQVRASLPASTPTPSQASPETTTAPQYSQPPPQPPPPTSPSPTRHITTLPTVVSMKFSNEIIEEYVDTINSLRSTIEELQSTVAVQSREIRALRSTRDSRSPAESCVIQDLELPSQTVLQHQRPKTANTAKTAETRRSPSHFNKGKTGVFGRLSQHAKVFNQRRNMDWNELKLVLQDEALHGIRHGKIPRDAFAQKKSSGPTKKNRGNNKKNTTTCDSEFKFDELHGVADLYSEMSQMACATLTSAEGAHRRTKHQHQTFWLSNQHMHPLTSSSSDICMISSQPQLFPPALNAHCPQILAYVDRHTLESVGLVSQQMLIWSHHVHVTAYQAEYVLDRIEPLARCWTTVVGQVDEAEEATSLLLNSVRSGQFVGLRRVHKPSPVLVDIIMSLGALLCPCDLPWKFVQVDRSLLRKKNYGGSKEITKGRVMLGAEWSHCQQLVMHVEDDGHMLSLLKRMERFNPDSMTRRQLHVLRGVVRSGILNSVTAKRGGSLASAVAKWIIAVTHRALALDKMKMLGVSLRKDCKHAFAIIEEAQWHAQVRQKLNDGKFRMFFGWT